MRFIVLLILIASFLPTNFSFSQDDQQVTINWLTPKKYVIENDQLIVPTIENQAWDNGKPTFYYQAKTKLKQATIDLIQVETQVAPNEDVAYLKKQHYIVTNELQVESKLTSDGKLNYVVVSMFPYLLKSGVYHRVTKFSIHQTPISEINLTATKSFKNSSLFICLKFLPNNGSF